MTDLRWLRLQRRVVELRIRTPNQTNYAGANAFHYGALNAAQQQAGGSHCVWRQA